MSLVVLAATVTASAIIAGAIAGFGRGLLGWATKRDPGEGINHRKLLRTAVIFTAAGVVVAIAGDPLTGGNIVAATGTTAILGVIIDDLYAKFSRTRREASRP